MIGTLTGTSRGMLTVPIGLPTSIGATAPAKAAVTVTVSGFAFSPAQVRAKVGDTIEWVNRDIFSHTATVRTGAFDVQPPRGGSGRTVARTAGTFELLHSPSHTAGQLEVSK